MAVGYLTVLCMTEIVDFMRWFSAGKADKRETEMSRTTVYAARIHFLYYSHAMCEIAYLLWKKKSQLGESLDYIGL